MEMYQISTIYIHSSKGEENMKIIKTVKDNKTITEIKLSGQDFTIIFAVLGSVKFIVKCLSNRR